MQFALEIVKRDLADDRVDHVLDLASQQRLPLGFVLGSVQKLAEGQHLAENAGGLGQRQGVEDSNSPWSAART